MREISKLRSLRFPILEKQTYYVDANDGGQEEGKLNPDHASVMPNANWYPKMDTYGHYRLSLFAASLPNKPQIAKSSPVADHPFSSAYTDVEYDIITRAAKLCGYEPQKLSDRNSKEPTDIHTKSPVNHNSGKHK